jgi:hypothetical protein
MKNLAMASRPCRSTADAFGRAPPSDSAGSDDQLQTSSVSASRKNVGEIAALGGNRAAWPFSFIASLSPLPSCC